MTPPPFGSKHFPIALGLATLTAKEPSVTLSTTLQRPLILYRLIVEEDIQLAPWRARLSKVALFLRGLRWIGWLFRWLPIITGDVFVESFATSHGEELMSSVPARLFSPDAIGIEFSGAPNKSVSVRLSHNHGKGVEVSIGVMVLGYEPSELTL